MNREIKFRCWDGNNMVMWEVTDLQWAKKGGLIYIRGTFIKDGKKEPIGGFKNQMTTKRWNNLKLIQYIGLKDKNGVEYYENDIAKLPDGSIYHIKSFEDVWYDIGYSDNCLKDELKKGEKLSNKFENPELLNEDNNETTSENK